MTIKELNNIGESVLRDGSLETAEDVLDVLERLDWTYIASKNLEENNGFYSTLLDIISDNVSKDKYKELTDVSAQTQKSILLLTILRIRSSITQYRLLHLRNEVESSLLEVSKETEEKLKTKADEIEKELKAKADEIEKELKAKADKTEDNINEHLEQCKTEFEKEIEKKIPDAVKNIEAQSLTTVMTLMGVFSAIITIIMSVVSTSSSWLNNADAASAVLAFVVPNCVAISAVVILLEIVFTKKQSEIVIVSGKNWNQPDAADEALKKAIRVHKMTGILVVIFITVSVALVWYEIKTAEKPHIRYVLSQGMYEYKETPATQDTPSSTVLEFTLNGKNYVFPYDKKYLHDGKLYYCEEDKQLE